MIELKSRHDPTPVFIDCVMIIWQKNNKIQQRVLCDSYDNIMKKVKRLRKKGRKVEVNMTSGMGLDIGDNDA